MNLRIKLTPPESYFLGDERIFEIGDGNKHYFIHSLQTPSQTTLFGILRYLGIKNPSANMEFDSVNIGEKSFNLLEPFDEERPFGRINGISPLYLMSGDNYYIRTPFDHKPGVFSNDKLAYNPFTVYRDDVLGTKKFPIEYEAKLMIADSWLCLSPSNDEYITYKNLFSKDLHVGIKKKGNEESFVKKEYAVLEKGFSFVFFADVDDDFEFFTNRFVKPGFFATIEKISESPIPQDLWRKNPNVIYALSDIYLSSNDVQKIYNHCDFVCVKTRNFRGRTTNPIATTIKARYKRYNEIATLINAGSIFIPKEELRTSVEEILTNNKYVQKAGFNHIVSRGVKL